MYPDKYALTRADEPCYIMAGSGEVVSFREFEARSNRLAHLLRATGLQRLDHYAVLMENHPRFLECCGAGARAGLYYTCINSYLKADELGYILDNSESRVLITSRSRLPVALEALAHCPGVALCLVVEAQAKFHLIKTAVVPEGACFVDDRGAAYQHKIVGKHLPHRVVSSGRQGVQA